MLNIMELQMNTTVKSHLIATWMAARKRQTIISVDQVGEKEPSTSLLHITGGNVKYFT